jgi:hypothetical protein
VENSQLSGSTTETKRKFRTKGLPQSVADLPMNSTTSYILDNAVSLSAAARKRNLPQPTSTSQVLTPLDDVIQHDNLFNKSNRVDIWREKLELLKLANPIDPAGHRMTIKQQEQKRAAFEQFSKRLQTTKT